MPAIPSWGTRADWRAWKSEQKKWEAERKRRDKVYRRAEGRGTELDATRPLEERLTAFRRQSIGTLGSIGSLAVINVVTSPHVPWALIPGAFMTLGILSRAGKLWADGVPLARLFSRGDLGSTGATSDARAIASPQPDSALELAAADVLAGPHGDAVRRAAADKRASHDLLARLSPTEREMLPDVGSTIDALATQVGALALTLHRLDADVGGSSSAALERRVAALRIESGDAPTPEQGRRLDLLERQRASIAELVKRRGVLSAQLESAVLALQNLRLDLLKLRASGIGGALSDIASATQEARALSREIGYAVDAAREVNSL